MHCSPYNMKSGGVYVFEAATPVLSRKYMLGYGSRTCRRLPLTQKTFVWPVFSSCTDQALRHAVSPLLPLSCNPTLTLAQIQSHWIQQRHAFRREDCSLILCLSTDTTSKRSTARIAVNPMHCLTYVETTACSQRCTHQKRAYIRLNSDCDHAFLTATNQVG